MTNAAPGDSTPTARPGHAARAPEACDPPRPLPQDARQSDKDRVAAFLDAHFSRPTRVADPNALESAVTQGVLAFVADQFPRAKYVLGLALDFALLAQEVCDAAGVGDSPRLSLSEKELFAIYPRIERRGNRTANTLSLQVGGRSFGIRKHEEAIVRLFHGLSRTDYPSAYVYNTGQWHKFRPLLLDCFRLSSATRRDLCERLIKFGLEQMPVNRYFHRAQQRVRTLQSIVSGYKREDPNENGGLVFQAIAYGYLKADRPHLSLIVDKVRTGSARQKRFGDIDGYSGLDLELSVEVKDLLITASNVHRELGGFLEEVSSRMVPAQVFVADIDTEAAEYLLGRGVLPFTQDDLMATIERWDWPKQDAATRGVLHYVAHVEQNPGAVKRLLAFLASVDPAHDSLAFARPAQVEG